jgi:ribonucleotide reductase alpha subunit
MATGRAYDSAEARTFAAAITSLMTATAYRRSAELAAIHGAYPGYARNADAHRRIMRRHADANAALSPPVTEPTSRRSTKPPASNGHGASPSAPHTDGATPRRVPSPRPEPSASSWTATPSAWNRTSRS